MLLPVAGSSGGKRKRTVVIIMYTMEIYHKVSQVQSVVMERVLQCSGSSQECWAGQRDAQEECYVLGACE